MDENIFKNQNNPENENDSFPQETTDPAEPETRQPAAGEDFNYNNGTYYGYTSHTNEEPKPFVPPEMQHQEKSYTPPVYGRQSVSPNGTPYPTGNPGTGKKGKQQKPVTRSGLVAACITTAVAASILTATIFSFGSGIGKLVDGGTAVSSVSSDSSGTVSKTAIVTESTDEAVVEAVAENVGPSVVGVVVTSAVNNFFYGGSSQSSQGSGIIYSEDGYIITNYHVISEAVESNGTLKVYLPSDVENAIDAAVIGYDVSSDLAVIKIEKTGLPAIAIGSSSSLKVGQTAIAVGNPGGLTFMGSVSKGIISGLDRVLQLENTKEIRLIQTDAAINPGNSGGALVNSSGQLIGVNSAKMASSDYEGMGFAIPVDSVVEICQRIIQNKDAPAPYIGVELSTYYSSDILQRMGYPAGVVVSGVADDSPASEAGIERGDIITEMNGTAVSSLSVFNSEKAKYSPGEKISLTIYRAGRSYSVDITLGTANS